MTAAAEIPSILISDMGQHGEVSKALGVLGHADSAICCRPPYGFNVSVPERRGGRSHMRPSDRAGAQLMMDVIRLADRQCDDRQGRIARP